MFGSKLSTGAPWIDETSSPDSSVCRWLRWLVAGQREKGLVVLKFEI